MRRPLTPLSSLVLVMRMIAAFALPTLLSASAGAVPVGPADFASSATVIDFEGLPSTALPNVPNVVFVSEGNALSLPWFDGDAPFIDSLFGENLYGNDVGLSTFSDLAIAFKVPVPAAGAWVGQIENFLNQSAPSLMVVVLDRTGAILENAVVDLPAPHQGPVFVGFSSSEGIGRIEWRGNGTGFFGVDNITFGEVVPEPSTGLLMLFGLGCIAWRRV